MSEVTEEMKRSYRMMHIINHAFYMAQILGLGNSVSRETKEKKFQEAVINFMDQITGVYKSPDEMAEDISAFAEAIKVDTRLRAVHIHGVEVSEEAN